MRGNTGETSFLLKNPLSSEISASLSISILGDCGGGGVGRVICRWRSRSCAAERVGLPPRRGTAGARLLVAAEDSICEVSLRKMPEFCQFDEIADKSKLLHDARESLGPSCARRFAVSEISPLVNNGDLELSKTMFGN